MVKLMTNDNKNIRKINISDIYVADIDNYDCYICAGYNEDKDFTENICRIYNIENSFVFDKNENVKNILSDKIIFYNLDIDIKRTINTANLSHFYNSYKNIFLKMNLHGKEFKWLYSIDMFYLLRFKQIVIYYYLEQEDELRQNICFEKLSFTHNIISLSENESYIIVVYLRKDIYDNDNNIEKYKDENNLIGITIENVAELI